jgi:dipeptidyl aminopeptidase/acylaminoacyl peptidase
VQYGIGKHGIELAVVRKIARIRKLKLKIRIIDASLRHHARRGIDTFYNRTLGRDFVGELTGSAPEVEDRFTWFGIEPVDYASTEIPYIAVAGLVPLNIPVFLGHDYERSRLGRGYVRRMLFMLLLAAFLLPAAETVSFRQAFISPDAKQVAFVQDGSIRVAPSGSYKAARKVSNGGGSSIVWSPDSTRLAWIQGQLYISDLKNAEPARKLTDAKGYMQSASWAPDGTQLAILFTENAKRAAGPTQAVTPDSGVVGENLDVQRIAIVNAETGAVEFVTPTDLYVHEYDWSPDGKSFAFTAAPPPGDNNWYDSLIYVMRIGEAPRVVYKPEFQVAVPRWSPDGKHIAYIEGLMSDEGSTGGEIYLVGADGKSSPRNLTPDRKSSPFWLEWSSPQQILFLEHTGGGSALASLKVSSGEAERLWQADESISMTLASDGTSAAAVRSGWAAPPEIWVGKPGSWRPFTEVNRDAKRETGEVKNIEWKSDGFDVQGYLMYPVPFDPEKKYPMIVSVHGGPGGVTKSSWSGRTGGYSRFSKLGYLVFYPNPRGSFGQGEMFTKANQRDLGFGDLRDILRGIDEIVKVAPVDPERLGIGGWSYGGYMAMMTVTQTNRFKAAVAGAGISNLQSYAGQNHITKWMFDYFGATVYDDPAVHARSSPMTYIKNAKTPTLILVGERDGECPPPQSYEFWAGLKAAGVKTQFVIYPGEGHGIRDPKHVADMNQRVEEWFRVHLQ